MRRLRLLIALFFAASMASAGFSADESPACRSIHSRSRVRARSTVSSHTLKQAEAHARKSRAVVHGELQEVAGRHLPFHADLVFEPVVQGGDEQLEIATFSHEGVAQQFVVRTVHGFSGAFSWAGEGLPAGAGFEAATNRLVQLFCRGELGRDYALAGWREAMSVADVRVVGTLRHQEMEVPWDRFWLFLIDDSPDRNWGHPCRYVLFSEDLSSYLVYFRSGPPEVHRRADDSRVPIESLAGTNAFDPVSPVQLARSVQAAADGVRSSVTVAPKGDASHTYCVLISGGASGTDNGSRFWSDTAAMYATLTLKYGIARDHIYTYLASGNSSSQDFYLTYYYGIYSSFVAVPYDLDNDGTADVNGGASYSNVKTLFTTTLKNKLTANDRLFVFITSHGGWDPAGSKDAFLCLFGDDYVDDWELSDWTKGLPCPVVFALEPCYSGGFIDDIVQTPNRAIATAANWNEPSSWCGEGGSEWYAHTSPYGWTCARNEWARHLTAALRGVYPATENSGGGYPWANSTGAASADGNGDGKVSFHEAAVFAANNDIEDEHPQYAESTTGLGDAFFFGGEGGVTPVPANDNFAQAATLSGASGAIQTSNGGATKESGESTHAGQESGKTVWWKWTPTTSGTVAFSTEGSDFDTVLAVYTGTSVASLHEIDSNDDNGSGGLWSRLSFEAVAGTTYRIVVGGYQDNAGAIKLGWESAAGPTPPAAGGTYYAQLTGINVFQHGWQDSLSSCISDVNHMYEAATDYGNWLAANVTRLTGTAATKSAVRAGVQALAAKAVAGDTVLFHHSAHGGPTSVCCYDDGGSYTKYEMADDLALFRSGVKVVVIVDACEAGGLFKSANGLSLGEEVRAIMRERERRNGGTNGGVNADSIGWITAVDEYHTALDDTFTPKLCKGWVNEYADSDGDGKINFHELYQYARDAGYGSGCGYAQCCNETALKASWARGEGESPVPPPPPPAELGFGPGKVSTFDVPGAGSAVLAGVSGASWDSFSSVDDCGNDCLVDGRIVDAEKSAAWTDDNYWCTALSQMNMLVWSGWAKDVGYESEDALANHFRQNPGLLRTKPASQSGWPSAGTYGYDGVFRWFADQTGGRELSVQSGSVGSSFPQVLKSALQDGNALVRMDVTSDCDYQPWLTHGGEISHSVLCCGYVLDPGLPSTDPAALVGLFLIDSDNDQYAGSGGSSAPDSISYVSVEWEGSNYYYYNVWGGRDGYSDAGSRYDVLHAKSGVAPMSDNDDFSDAAKLSGEDGSVAADSSEASSESHEPVEGRTLWWRWTAPSDGTVTLEVEDCAFDPVIGVYTGDRLRELEEVAVAKSAKVSFEAEEGVEYRIVVAGEDEDEGGLFTLSWRMSGDGEGGGSGGGTGSGALPSLAVASDASYTVAVKGAYSGWLVNRKTKTLEGSITVKAPKASRDRTVKLTASVTLRGQAKALSFSGIGRIEADKKDKVDKLVAQLICKKGGTLDLSLSSNRVTGSLDGAYDVDGVSDTVNKQGAVAHQGDWVLSSHAIPTMGEFGGFCGFTVKVNAKGTAKLSGTLPDGTKLSFTTRIVSDGKTTYLPVFGKAYSKKGDFGGLVIDMDKGKSCVKADGYWDGAAAKVPVQAKVSFVGFARVGITSPSAGLVGEFGPAAPDKVKEKPPQEIGGFPVLEDYIPSKLALTFVGKKWEPMANPSKLKLTYTPKTGVIKGSFTIETSGKKFKAAVNGVWLDGHGDCNASVKGKAGFGMRISQ